MSTEAKKSCLTCSEEQSDVSGSCMDTAQSTSEDGRNQMHAIKTHVHCRQKEPSEHLQCTCQIGNDITGKQGTCTVCSTKYKKCMCNCVKTYLSSTYRTYDESDIQIIDTLQFQRSLNFLYGVIVALIVFIMIGFVVVQNEVSSLRKECLTRVENSPDIRKYGMVYNESENRLNVKRVKKRSIDKSEYFSRKSVQKQIFQMHKRHKRSDMTQTIHEYCRTVFNLCDAKLYPGPPGHPGVPVAIGPPGPPGPMGPKGEPGLQGARGPPGRFGFDGIAGTPGDKGEPGVKGDRGLVGFSGEKGDIGNPGAKGDKGSPGLPGPRGPLGPQGPPGPDGPPGPKGDEGRRGKSGKDGEKGDKGHKGVDGIPGVPGFKGEQGLLGERGPPGYGINCICEKGDKGEKGQRGLVGFTGYKGEKGLKGEHGHKGDRGFGLKGEQGPLGPPGNRGQKGQKGDCDLWQNERKDWRYVNVETDGEGKKKLNDIPQQDYQAHEESTKYTSSSGTRGSRSSGTNSVNLATQAISSYIPVLMGVLMQLSLNYL